MRKFASYGPRVAKRRKRVADLGTREGGVVVHAREPVGRPAEVFNQLARQAKRQVEAADPWPGLRQARGKRRLAGQTLQFG